MELLPPPGDSFHDSTSKVYGVVSRLPRVIAVSYIQRSSSIQDPYKSHPNIPIPNINPAVQTRVAVRTCAAFLHEPFRAPCNRATNPSKSILTGVDIEKGVRTLVFLTSIFSAWVNYLLLVLKWNAFQSTKNRPKVFKLCCCGEHQQTSVPTVSLMLHYVQSQNRRQHIRSICVPRSPKHHVLTLHIHVHRFT